MVATKWLCRNRVDRDKNGKNKDMTAVDSRV